MLKRILFLTVFSLLIPFIASEKPLYISNDKKITIQSIIPYGENQFFDGQAPLAPSLEHLLGTDDRGRDLLVRLLYGFRNNFLYCLSLSAFICVIALLLGVGSVILSHPFKGLLVLLTESLFCLPFYFLLIAILSVVESSHGIYFTCLFFFWPPFALLVRSEASKVLTSNYILSAKAMGVTKSRILFFHLLPNCLTPLKAAFPLVFSGLFSLLAYVHYLGIASFEPQASLGELLSEAKSNITNPYLVFAPLIACLIPLSLLMPTKPSKVLFKKLQLYYLSYFERMENFFRQENRLTRFIKLPKQMSGERLRN